MKFDDIKKVLLLIANAQENEKEQREKCREARSFIYDRDGMWDEYAKTKLTNRFRGTFDMCTPIVDGIAGEIDKSDFSLRISPSGGGASKEDAKTLDGLIRSIRNISNADDIFNNNGRNNVISGFDCVEVVQDWVDNNSFDQDLFIKKIPDSVNNVYFDQTSIEQDRSDAKWGVKLIDMQLDEYKKEFKKGSQSSIEKYYYNDYDCLSKKDVVTIAKIYYQKPERIQIALMSDGSVYEINEEFESIQDELAQAGIAIAKDNNGNDKIRTRNSFKIYSRMLDGKDFLTEEEETVFDYVPLVPIYGNFNIIDSQSIYFGKLENLFDPQRVLNYALSRDIEDGALSPPQTIWMTDKQAEGNDYSRMNTDHQPIRIYNADKDAPPIGQGSVTGGAQPSNALQTTIANAQQMIGSSSNTFTAQQGNAAATQSGIAGEQQIEQGNIGSIKWFKAMEKQICQVGKILIRAIPKVYDSTRKVRILEEDGSSKMVTLNKSVFDVDAQKVVTLNDLSLGDYDVVCEMGAAFTSSQKEAARSFETMASILPEFAQTGLDIWLKNKKEVGMDLMAERFREQLFNAGVIPESQWTEEEQQKVAQQQAQAQQQPQEDPNMLIAQAELQKAQAEQMIAQNKQAEIQGNQQLKELELQLKNKQIDLDTQKFIKGQDDDFNLNAAKIDQGQQKIDLQAQSQQQQAVLSAMKQQQDEINSHYANLKLLFDSIGANAIVGDSNIEAYKDQVDIIEENQDNILDEDASEQ